MPPRPHLNKRIDELEQFFDTSCDSLDELRVLASELASRSSSRAHALAAKVFARMAELGTDSTGEDDIRQEPTRTDSQETYTEFVPPATFSLVQAPPVKGRPAQFKPPMQTDISLESSPDDTPVTTFRIALEALIAEMKRRHLGQQTFLLENGRAVAREASGYTYQFGFAEEATLFEGAKIELVLGGRTVSGNLTAIREGEGVIVITYKTISADELTPAYLK